LGKRINFQSSGGFVLAEREAKLGMTAIDGVKRIRYPSLASVVVENRLRRQTLAEEMRILYVAMTRAKEHLILSGTCDPKLIQEWSGGHAGRIGAMPANIVHSANTMLDWVGPVWAMDAKESFIRLHRHEVEEVRKWLDEHDPSKPRSLPPENLANLRPLTPAPAADVIGAEVIARLTREYAFEPYTTMPASQPLTAVAKSGALPVAEADDQHASSGKALADPPFLLGQRPLSPEDRGTATHLFLEHLDFSQPPQSLEQQLQRLLERKIITREQAEAVNLDDVRCLLDSPVGALLRAKAGEILRELPINFSHAQSDVPDPLDRTMLRGRIDLLVPDDRGFVLIDYKTDDVRSSDLLRLRGEFYAPQLALYSQAITQITGRPVHTAHLAFLSARQIVTTTLASR
jgi:ATP-dependent helicase/nuclease subunit A